MYGNSVSSIRIVRGETKEFPITIGLHQVLVLSDYMFALLKYELIKHI